jgi:hypothetical protein
VIGVCGGHFRDLLRLLRDTVVRATSLSDLPVPYRDRKRDRDRVPRFSTNSTG